MEKFIISIAVLVSGLNFASGGYLLKSEYYNELSCPKEIPLFQGKINLPWALFPYNWYIPMGSERVYRLSAEILLGRPARSSAELDLINLRVRSSKKFYKIVGFHEKSFRKACVPINLPLRTFPNNIKQTTCFALWGSRGTNVEPATRAVDSIVWTDNENAMLITPCNENIYDWFVLTKRPTISDHVKKTILAEISKLGFNPNNAAYYDYENQRFFPKVYTKSIVQDFIPFPVYETKKQEISYGPPIYEAKKEAVSYGFSKKDEVSYGPPVYEAKNEAVSYGLPKKEIVSYGPPVYEAKKDEISYGPPVYEAKKDEISYGPPSVHAQNYYETPQIEKKSKVYSSGHGSVGANYEIIHQSASVSHSNFSPAPIATFGPHSYLYTVYGKK